MWDCAVADVARADVGTGGVTVAGAGGVAAVLAADGATGADAAPGVAWDSVLRRSGNRTIADRDGAAWSRGGCLP